MVGINLGREKGLFTYGRIFQRPLDERFWEIRDIELKTTISWDSIKSTATGGTPISIFFRDDGKKMYIGDGVQIAEFDLGNPWEINDSLTFVGKSADLTAGGNPVGNGLFFKPDGTKVFWTDTAGSNQINQSTLSTAWDITSMGAITTYTTASDSIGLWFNKAGDEAFAMIFNAGSYRLYALPLTTPWDITSVSGASFITPAEETQMEGINMSINGRKVILFGTDNDSFYEYELTNQGSYQFQADQIVANAYGNKTKRPQQGNAGFFINKQGNKMFQTVTGAFDGIEQYDFKETRDSSR
jgi:hypothetical protein|tara:strand:- start:1956 stop:2852 length:897 start_codon:yes stop_codon:yes gene_type:complete